MLVLTINVTLRRTVASFSTCWRRVVSH